MAKARRVQRTSKKELVSRWISIPLWISFAALFSLSVHAQLPSGPRVEEGLKGIQKPEDRLLQPGELKPVPEEAPLRLPPVLPRPKPSGELAPGIRVTFIGAGHITEAFAKNMARLLREAVNFDKLRDVLRSTDLANTSATRRAMTEYADTISFAKVTPVLDDVATLSKSAGPAETVRLLKYADNTDDLARLSKMSGKLGTKTRGIIEITGKTSLRAFKTVANLALLALQWIWEIGAAIGALFLSGLARSVRKRRRRRRMFAA